jgi:riboflavin transporter FmnP
MERPTKDLDKDVEDTITQLMNSYVDDPLGKAGEFYAGRLQILTNYSLYKSQRSLIRWSKSAGIGTMILAFATIALAYVTYVR